MSTISQSSYKQDETCFRKWWEFCVKNLVDPFRSSVSDKIKLVGPEIASDYRMLRFFKGISKARPSKPKYATTWDPKIVLDFYSKEKDNNKLSLKELSMKLICPMTLVTAHRM